jgi:serine protease Do
MGWHKTPFFSDPFFRHFFGPGADPHPQQRRENSLGSGVIVSGDGVVLTNNHVVEHADDILVTLHDRREIEAKVVSADPKSDLAVLRLEGHPKDLHPLSFGDSSRLRLGDVVLAIGNPFGVGQTVTMGIVSAKGRANVGIVDYEDFIQTDAAINPGNSGGALINMAGALVGINTAILSRTGGYQGIGFAIPSNMARPIMESLLKHGKVVRGWLGVAIQNLSPQLAKAFDLEVHSGVLISDVTPGSPAAKAGLQRGDVVSRLDGEQIDTAAQLRNIVASTGPDKSIRLEIIRNDKRLVRTVKLGELPTAHHGVLEESEGQLNGLTLQNLDRAARRKHHISERVPSGVVVKAVAPGSPAAGSGVRPGDVIVEINRSPVKSVEQFGKLYQAATGKLLLLIYRDGNTMYVLLER